MSLEPYLAETAAALVRREGWLLDQRDWDAWLDLYTEDAEYWLPSWDDEYTLCADPDNDVSLIYYSGRAGLEDRVYRIRTRRSLASTPLPRTCHMTSVISADTDPANSDRLIVESNWTTHSYKHQTATYFFGQQTHWLVKETEGLRIARRKVVVANDRIPSVLDIYSV